MDERLTFMTNEEMKVGFLHYFKKISKPIKKDYEPMSFDMWKMFRDLEPTKFGLNYDDYVRLKEKQYNDSLEKMKNVTLELISFRYNTDEFNLLNTQKNIRDIEQDPLFNNWADVELKEKILNIKI